jgi:hypothetical protein
VFSQSDQTRSHLHPGKEFNGGFRSRKPPPMQKRYEDQTIPWAIMASATFTKPAMLAPFT